MDVKETIGSMKLAGLLALCAAGAPAAVWTVRPAGPLARIQQAVDAAGPGDTIRIEPGTYAGNVVLDRKLTLEGVGHPVIRGEGRSSVITVKAEGCTIRNLVIEHSGEMLAEEDSGLLLHSSGNRIEHNELRDVLFGIYLYQSDNNVLLDNEIRGRAWLGMGERGAGIHIWNSTGNTITANTISEARDGMYLQNAYHTLVAHNRVHDLRYGLHYMSSDDNRFEDNQFYDSVAGAAIMYSRRIEFRRNVFRHNRGFSSFGILFQDSEGCTAEENAFVDNAVGIFMEALRASAFRRNLIAANDTAIQAFSSASGNTFSGNNFIANLSPIEVVGRTTETRWSEAGRGNYWSDYQGYDLDENGVGDVPFKIQNVFERMEGDYPRLRLYLFSPASQALAVSEKVVPLIRGSEEYDRFPLMKPVEMRVEGGSAASQEPDSIWPPLAMLAASLLVMAWGKLR
ncbi:MAG TPA: nitrous oxide reductase family maturation protein NosD [Bryobacteraceae bacterium]|nr:nitrous oxide reductase family maturation protein NosD [Bryobacteraceae bacterium]